MFTVQNAYKLATQGHNLIHAAGSSSTHRDGNRTLWNKVWKAHVPQKMKIIAWRVLTGRCDASMQEEQTHLYTGNLPSLWGGGGEHIPCADFLLAGTYSLGKHESTVASPWR